MGSINRSFSKLGKKVSQKTQAFAHRTSDKHIRLAVTGLSGAGKTAFITGLVNQLLNAGLMGKSNNLPLWQVTREERLYGVKRDLQPDLTVTSFDYEQAMASLKQSPSQWPASTRSISELRLAIRYQPQKGLLAKLTDSATLYLDIIDYPGEWLLDLPMLKQSFSQWSMSQTRREHIFKKSDCYGPFNEAVSQLDLFGEADAAQLKQIADLYQQLLLDCVNGHGFYYAQPGRLLLPGELVDTPVLALFPLLGLSVETVTQLDAGASNTAYQVLKTRYKQYQSKVIMPFYREYFAKFDRQLLLVDCFTPLNSGKDQFDDMTQALNGIMESFKFGQSNILKRLFSPRIDKLLFAASKVDHITRDQQGNVLSLLTQLVKQSQKQAKFEGCEVEVMAISAIKATKHAMVRSGSAEVEVVHGVDLSQRKTVTVFPGEVPKTLPQASFWDSQGFEFTHFAPPQVTPSTQGADFEHIRLDHLLQYLLGDKLK
ncbi:YcjX family protein [Shewanella canadensis]|uniref:YcjX family protein n=1 Tax=Shewanella canadensis TaxID=271096 RepID=A0A431WTW0_9GAMM|nr:YcjX family protein [Shewanella canadensis]RTR38589.1 YcjX family protein [Shewanella canadensis]